LKEYYKINKSKISKKNKVYYKINKDKIAKYYKEYYVNNKKENNIIKNSETTNLFLSPFFPILM
jgi:hypothetical protein